MQNFTFTSESVSCGHPDKMADQISDAVLDAIIAQDPYARVACETLIKTGMVFIAGEITTHAWVDIEHIVRQQVLKIGYNDPSLGFNGHTCSIISAIGKQSADIAMGVDHDTDLNVGAGDQGFMFGYASNETPQFMPAPITYSHQLLQRQMMMRRSNLPWLGPDAKAQLSCRYENQKPVAIDTVVLSTQHQDNISLDTLREAVMEHIILPILPEKWLHKDTRYLINPTGRFVIGGPASDCGLTGRKIIVDTYGGTARHGGGCFSGKDPTKVDRTGAYAARYIAKNIVASGLAERAEVQLAYAIGIAEPVSLMIDTFGTGQTNEETLSQAILELVDLRPGAIIERFDLRRPIYTPTAAYGHFGRADIEFPWEQTDLVDQLQQATGQSSSQTHL